MYSDPRSGPAIPVPVALQLVLGVFLLASTFSIALTQTALGLALILWFFLALKRKAPVPRRTTLDVPVLLLIVVSFIAALLSDRRIASLINLKNYALMTVIYVIGSLLTTRRMALRQFAVLLASGAGVAAYGIAIYLLGKGFGTLGRSPGPFSNAMTFGGILLILCSLFLAVAAGAGVVKRLRCAAIGAAIVSFVALFFTFTRSSWVGAVISVVIILAFLRRRWLVPFAVALVLFVLLLPAQYRARVESIWNLKHPSNVHRLQLLKGSMGIIRDHPVIGVGTMDLADVYRRYMPPDAVQVFGHMHNIFLQIAVQTGFVGLAAFCWLLFAFFRLIVRNLKLDLPPPERAWVVGSIGALAGFIVNGLFEWNFGDAEVVTLLYIVLGDNLALSRMFQPAATAPRAESAFAYKPRIG
ncbi:MAG: O-antigen ligase family protein [Candidatus Krumholzibacteria bacterium]|nr:O-antigen ligase family protein [Candidatus Krumholzibacteria bacterium]